MYLLNPGEESFFSPSFLWNSSVDPVIFFLFLILRLSDAGHGGQTTPSLTEGPNPQTSSFDR
jgi:hypothetical protein